MMKDISALAKIPYLAEVPFSQVASLAEAIEVMEVEDGHVFTEEGDLDDTIYFVLDGAVELSTSASGQRRAIGARGVGELFGLISVVDNAPRWASVTAKGKVRAGKLDRSSFQMLTMDNAPLALGFQRALGVQLAKSFRHLGRLVQEQLSRIPMEEPPAPDGEAEEVDCDVAVLGGGPLGMMYAQFVKRMRPGTKVVQLERRAVPGYKVGESTLSTTVRCFLAMGFTMPQLRRLFGNKAGIRFWWAGEESERPEQECDIVDLEETFQIERRVFEMALQRLTREQGVDLRTGTHVEIDDCELDGEVKKLACTGPDGDHYTLKTRFVCGATGPAAVLPRHLGTYRKDPSLYDTFQTNCYFAYFKQKKDVPLKRWQEAATRHLCTPHGWVWFITVHSWESADDETMLNMVNDVMDHTSMSDDDVPPRREFADKHGLDFELITSIGITVRDDMDTSKGLPIQKRFKHYVEKYPALSWILDHYEIIEKPYREKRRPYAAFLGLAHDSTQAAGDGWVAIGDSAQFSNPLFSHGINYGSGSAYMAAKDTVKALDEANYTRSGFATYEKYCNELFPVLMQETDFYYRSWAHPLGFQKTLQAKFHWGAIDVLELEDYSDRDPYVFDPLNPKWTGLIDGVLDIAKRREADGGCAEKMAADIAALIDPFNEECRVRAREMNIDLNAVFNNFDGDGRRVEDKQDKPRAYFKAYLCSTCNLWQDDVLSRCPNCGTDNPVQFMAGMDDEKKKLDVAEPEADSGSSALPMSSPPGEGGPEREVPAPAPAKRGKKSYHAISVAEVVEETAEARSIVLDVPDELREQFSNYRPGQFVTLLVEVGGEELKRAYSLSTAPAVDAKPRITVKRVVGGKVSNWLCDEVGVGTILKVLPPSGRFTVPDKDGDLFLFAAGSGITPVFSIAREYLATSDRKVRLVYVNRSKEETILRAELDAMKRKYGKRFKLKHRLGGREGRIDTRDVQAYCDEITDGLYFVCGPWGFMDVVEEGLLDMGVEPDRMHVERFASPKKQQAAVENKATAESPAPVEPAGKVGSTITLNIFGEVHEVPYKKGQYLTDAAADHDVDAPCSCEEGFCGTCLARVVEGTVEMDCDDALTKGQKKRGMILACQARATSDKLVVAFES